MCSNFVNGFKVEIDIDGVIADIHNGLNNVVSKEFGIDFNGERDICSWGMKELEPDVRKFILKQFSSPEFIGGLRYIGYSIEALTLLDMMLRRLGGKIVLNTNVNSPCVEARKEWLKGLLKLTGVKAECVVGADINKVMLEDSYVVVEDNADNLKRSNAPYKFLIKRGHNRYIKESDLNDEGCKSKVFIVDDLWCVFGVLQKELNLVY